MPNADQCRIAAILNGDVVTDSDGDNPKDYVGITSVTSEGVKRIVAKQRMSLSRRVRRQKAKSLASRNFLSHKIMQQANETEVLLTNFLIFEKP